ncbi:unnamed protein product [Dovyalis caffra]|uniref:Uncharacterized protein n=1 Tax=Dovyalis caffra TaxID=77055 RepID=A0AAV1RCY9_9ROSI|nr:unnamed protein product [Dovyalis caffra]
MEHQRLGDEDKLLQRKCSTNGWEIKDKPLQWDIKSQNPTTVEVEDGGLGDQKVTFGKSKRPPDGTLCSATTDSTDTREVNQGIAQLYDKSFGVWEDIWGDHMHHVFCDPVSETDSDHRAARYE